MALRLSESQWEQLKNKGVYVTDSNKAIKSKEGESKYKNEKVFFDGKKFDSKKELDRYHELCLLMRAGLIRELCCQVKFELEKGVYLFGECKKKGAIHYIADFAYIDNKTGLYVVEDVKSKKTKQLSTYRLKKHLMKSRLNIDVIEILY